MTAVVGSRPSLRGAWVVAGREIRDQLRDWRILAPIVLLTLFFPMLMNFTARTAIDFVNRYGAPIIAERLIPFLLMVVGFFPISISLVIALETFAGERERLSLEPLLATPLSNAELYLGKMLASLATPLAAAYLGIGVYLSGLVTRLGWTPPPVLLLEVFALTTVQAIVMVAGAVVISSLTTSVRAANLLASFIIIPVAQLIIGESLIMFWGRYHVLWWIILALFLIGALLVRSGLQLFDREELLSREMDALDFRWAWRTFRAAFLGGARSLAEWYAGLFRMTVPKLGTCLAILAVALAAGYFVGLRFAAQWPMPADMLDFEDVRATLGANFESFGLLSGTGWLWVFSNNVRAILLASLVGAFTFGVLAVVLLMTPVGIVGYFAGNLAAVGEPAALYLAGLVLPHALLEVPAAIFAGAAILRLGLVAVSPAGGRSLGTSWLSALAEWARVMLGIVVPLLAAAAAIEVFLTPRIALLVLPGG
ncbi:MAG TPA: stage II sporulation protein M [Anaerolineales bacterium]|nr:stage II sporulation protein M [Anaerolineales bacterium]